MTKLHRRKLLKLAGAVPAFGTAAWTAEGLVVFLDPKNPVTGSAPVARALKVLHDALAHAGAGMQMPTLLPILLREGR